MEEINKELFNYGILGIWTIYLLIQNYKQNEKENEFIKILEEIKNELKRLK